jgi:hypothetical protein
VGVWTVAYTAGKSRRKFYNVAGFMDSPERYLEMCSPLAGRLAFSLDGWLYLTGMVAGWLGWRLYDWVLNR